MVPRTLRLLILTICLLGLLAGTAAAEAATSPISGQPAQSGAVVQDTKLGRLYIALPVGNSVMVLATADMSMKAVFAVPPRPSALALDPHLHRIYVASDLSGVISVFDSHSYKLLQRRHIGGHPAGLAISAYGKVLIVTDSQSGAVLRLPTQPLLGAPSLAMSLGPDAASRVLLAQDTLSAGHSSQVWARGFQPNEPVDLYWGVHLLRRITANDAGIVTTAVAVPHGSDLGLHLVILIGQSSTRSESTLINVVQPPPPPAPPKVVPVQHSWKDTLGRLLKPRVTVVVPSFAAIGPLKSLKSARPSGGVPVMIVLVLLTAIITVLLLRLGRKRRKRIRAAPPPPARQTLPARPAPAGAAVPASRPSPGGIPGNLRQAS